MSSIDGRDRGPEHHAVQHIGWLRAAVLGANDGLLSTASLIVGVAGAGSGYGAILLSGTAGLIAGSLSMAAGEYVSVSSQADLEAADLAREAAELQRNPRAEHRELAGIYMGRGVSPETAQTVARELMEHDALAAHARDELGLAEVTSARPLQAAAASAASFACGAALPLLVAVLSPRRIVVPLIIGATILCLALLGAIGAATGRAPVGRATVRVVFLGALALGATLLLGHALGGVVG